MAYADYRLCDVCDCKTFYDANLNYEYVKGKGQVLDYLGDWKVLCQDCVKTHEVKIVKKRKAK